MFSLTRFSFIIAVLTGTAAICAQQAPGKSTEPRSTSQKKAEFKSFTGRVVTNKVRIRSKPDVESTIVRQVNKGDLLLIVGEMGDFWAIQPPTGTKAYVFRTYVLDNVVEANRVNVRLEPHVNAPIIGQLQTGERVEGSICAINNKWLEITPPKNSCFYVAKELMEQAGGPEFITIMQEKKKEASELLNSALFAAEAESKKPYDEMSPQLPMQQFQNVISSYAEFPDFVQTAKEGLSLLKDTYLQKKIAYLEERAELSSKDKEALLAQHRMEKSTLHLPESGNASAVWRAHTNGANQTGAMCFWNTVEESLYLSWAAFHTDKKLDDFYQEQKANATVVAGKIETYTQSVKNKPGDFVLRGEVAPIAYLYSTQVDLNKLVGQNVTMLVSPRPNNHFAFPAYFVLSVE